MIFGTSFEKYIREGWLVKGKVKLPILLHGTPADESVIKVSDG